VITKKPQPLTKSARLDVAAGVNLITAKVYMQSFRPCKLSELWYMGWHPVLA